MITIVHQMRLKLSSAVFVLVDDTLCACVRHRLRGPLKYHTAQNVVTVHFFRNTSEPDVALSPFGSRYIFDAAVCMLLSQTLQRQIIG